MGAPVSALGQESVPQRASRVASRTVDGHTVLVVLDQRQVHRLDPVGSRIWELCGDRSVAEICLAVTEEFDVESDVARRDVLQFLEELQRVGALRPEVAP